MPSDQEILDLFRLYLDEVGRHPLLTKDDEIELSQAYEAGLDAQLKLADCTDDPARPELEATATRGEWARRKMIESNLRLVVSIARRFSATGQTLGDLVQEGNLGLLRAVEKFDWRKGFKFSTYATWWIRQAIQRDRVVAQVGRGRLGDAPGPLPLLAVVPHQPGQGGGPLREGSLDAPHGCRKRSCRVMT